MTKPTPAAILAKALAYIEANSFGGTDTIELIEEIRALAASPNTTASLTALPALRAPFAGGIFAGITTIKDGTHCAVALLPDQGSNLDHPAATQWAEALGGTLPTRPVAAMLFANLKDQLRTGWHWTCEQDEDDASYAWFCFFDSGFQDYTREFCAGSAVAVRLIPLNS